MFVLLALTVLLADALCGIFSASKTSNARAVDRSLLKITPEELTEATCNTVTGSAATTVAVDLSPLFVGVVGMWGDAAQVLSELWILTTLTERGLGRRLEPVRFAANTDDYLASADIILFGPFADRKRTSDIARRYYNRSVLIFIAGENTRKDAYVTFADQMVDEVHISLGHRRDMGRAASYHRLPLWLIFVLQKDCGCVFPPGLRKKGNADEWRAREGFASLLSSHSSYPRSELFNLMSAIGRVDAPGNAFHNVEWPADLPNSLLAGKVEWLHRYRYNICPENSRTPDSGYNTEKAVQALLSGAVPIYWGDVPMDPQVFNPRRFIFYDGTDGSVVDVVNALENDNSFRDMWFDEPILVPGADQWLHLWCHRAEIMLRESFNGVQSARSVPV